MAVRGLTKRYGEFRAVDELDLAIDRGTLFGFLGPNGAGKTTTIRMILGLILPSQGSVEVLGQRMAGDGSATRAGVRALERVGALIEEPSAWSYLSGRRNLEAMARAGRSGQDRRRRLDRIDEVLRLVELEDAAHKKVKAYSQGMRQRLGIAGALLGEPELLVLDEPTNGLDPRGMREVRQLLRRLADEGTTVFVSSHLLWEVEAMCDRVGVLARGRLVADGPPSSLRPSANRLRIEVDDEARAHAVLATLDGARLDGRTPEDRPGVVRVELSGPATSSAVNAALVSAGVAVSALVPEHESLEDVFVSLVEGDDVPR